MSNLDPILLGAIAGGGIFIGLVTVLALLLILNPGRHARRGTGEPRPLPLRAVVTVLLSGVLLVSLGLPVALLALASDEPGSAADSPVVVATEPSANTTPEVPVATSTPSGTAPTAEPEPDTEPETPEPSAGLVLSRLQLTPDPDSGHNWYRVSVNVANPADKAASMLLGGRVGDRIVAAQQVTLGAGDNVTLEIDSLAREIGFLATMYENGLVTQRRYEVVVGNLRETLVFETPLRLQSTASGQIIQPDWEMLNHQVSDVETLTDGGLNTYRVSWQVTLRSNTMPDRTFQVTVTLYDATGDIVKQAVVADNALPRWDTETFSGFIDLTAVEKDRIASYTLNVICTSGCGEAPE